MGSEIVASRIKQYLNKLCQDKQASRVVIISFDRFEVSGHSNHVDVHLGVRHLLQHAPKGMYQLEAWQLETIQNPLLKYCPVWDLVIMVVRWLMEEKDKKASYIKNPPRDRIWTSTLIMIPNANSMGSTYNLLHSCKRT